MARSTNPSAEEILATLQDLSLDELDEKIEELANQKKALEQLRKMAAARQGVEAPAGSGGTRKPGKMHVMTARKLVRRLLMANGPTSLDGIKSNLGMSEDAVKTALNCSQFTKTPDGRFRVLKD